MNSPAEDIKTILEASGLGLVFKENLFISREPSAHDNCVTIFDTSGFPPQLTYSQEERYQYPGVQIRVRNDKYTDGITLAQQIFDFLHGRANETVGGTLYTVIHATGNPALLDYDDNKRPRFIINFNLQRR